jgi:hypothetical protein
MSNTSATGGSLTSTLTPAPLEDQALLDFLQSWIVGITGLPQTTVRPRWQPEPGNIPNESTNWVAFGIPRRESDVNAAELHFPSNPGYNEIRRHEILNILASFYGPNANGYAEIFREGIQVAQNREVLSLNAMGLVESGDVIALPELVKNKWYTRADLTFRIRRQIVRQYAVLNISEVDGSVNNELYTTQIKVL